jgi:hypothetical protein
MQTRAGSPRVSCHRRRARPPSAVVVIRGDIGQIVQRDGVAVVVIVENIIVVDIDIGIIVVIDVDVVLENQILFGFLLGLGAGFAGFSATRARPPLPVSISTTSPE